MIFKYKILALESEIMRIINVVLMNWNYTIKGMGKQNAQFCARFVKVIENEFKIN